MAQIKIVWTDTARIQRKEILLYWKKRNKSTNFSRKLKSKIKERTDLLKLHPEMGKKTVIPNVDTISLGNYSLFYLKRKNDIIIVSFWDNRQDPNLLLQILKKP